MRIIKGLVLVAITVLIVGAGVLSFDSWKAWLLSDGSNPGVNEEERAHEHHGAEERVRLSPQARANLRLVVKPIRLETYRRSIQVPAVIVERPDEGDLGVPAPVAGVVTRIATVPGDTVRPGDELFTLRLRSESLQNSQAQLYKTVRDLEINEREQKRLSDQPEGKSLFRARLIELGYEHERLSAAVDVGRQDLLARGLTTEQIEQVMKGKFLTEIKIKVPQDMRGGGVSTKADEKSADRRPDYEVEELKVRLGELVEAGGLLCILASHQFLYIEGRGFEEDAAALERATQQGWPLSAEFEEQAGLSWPPFAEKLQINFMGAKVDPTSRTFPFYVPLTNQYRERQGKAGKKDRVWRFRPGQRVRLFVPVEQFADAFVLPAEAVVREGPETYVFRANGDVFDRRPVHVLHEDRRHVVIANDGSITAGNSIAHNGAARLNWALKARTGDTGHHHGHEH